MASIETLYDKNVQIRIQNNNLSALNTFESDTKSTQSRIATIRIQLKIQIQPSPSHKRDLILRLTDDNNWFFLYTLNLGEEDFSVLRQQQGLLVDFITFPNSLIQLIDSCDSVSNLQKGNSQSSSSFNLNLIQPESQSSPAQLNILEINAFRQITHLNLKLTQGDDTDIKDYLAECLSTLKQSLEKTSSELTNTRSHFTSRLESAETEVARLENKNNELHRDLLTKTDKLTAQYKIEISKLREEKSKNEAHLQNVGRKDREELESLLKSERTELNDKILELESINKELTARKFRSDGQIREQKLKINSLEEELNSLNGEVVKLRSHNRELNVERHDHEKIISNLKTQVALLEQEVKNKLELIDKTGNQIEKFEEYKINSDERINELKRANDQLNKKFNSRGDELVKANEIIQRQHGSIKELKYKNELKSVMASQNESAIQSKSQQLSDQIKQVDSLKLKLQTSESNLSQAQQSINEMQDKLKNNENCIQWLNKQLNDKTISGGSVSNYSVNRFNNNSSNSTQANYLNYKAKESPNKFNSVPNSARRSLNGSENFTLKSNLKGQMITNNIPSPIHKKVTINYDLDYSKGDTKFTSNKYPTSTPLVRNPNLRFNRKSGEDPLSYLKENTNPDSPAKVAVPFSPSNYSPKPTTPVKDKIFSLDPKYFSPATQKPDENENFESGDPSTTSIVNDYMNGIIGRKSLKFFGQKI